METKIPAELQEKYSVQDINALVSMGHTEYEAARVHYYSFLSNTDYIPLKLIEGSITSADVFEELKYREIARQEIARIKGKPYEPKEEIKTLDERTEAAESNIDYLSMMTGVDIPTEV